MRSLSADNELKETPHVIELAGASCTVRSEAVAQGSSPVLYRDFISVPSTLHCIISLSYSFYSPPADGDGLIKKDIHLFLNKK